MTINSPHSFIGLEHSQKPYSGHPPFISYYEGRVKRYTITGFALAECSTFLYVEVDDSVG